MKRELSTWTKICNKGMPKQKIAIKDVLYNTYNKCLNFYIGFKLHKALCWLYIVIFYSKTFPLCQRIIILLLFVNQEFEILAVKGLKMRIITIAYIDNFQVFNYTLYLVIINIMIEYWSANCLDNISDLVLHYYLVMHNSCSTIIQKHVHICKDYG